MDVLRAGHHSYRLLRKLGEGGQGSVYEAEDLDAGTRVAIKLMRLSQRGGDEALNRFKREFRSRERVRHRSLAEFGELAYCDDTWFFSMALVKGERLLEHVSRPDCSELQLRSCFRQLAEGLSALHAAGLVHRDIKSDNVLVEDERRVVLVDFGLVFDMEPGQSTQVIGTPAYMAPELWGDAKPSAQSDWYAFGVLLFEALSGGPAFSGSQLEVFLAKTQQPAPNLRAVARALPADLVSLCEGLLCCDRAARLGQEAVLRCLADGPKVAIQRAEGEPCLVGRDDELHQLDRLLADVQHESGRAKLLLLYGSSGIGKTALMRAFGKRALERGAWLLSGRCYEAESVPFKAFDEALDGLARRLKREAKSTLDAYRPRHASLLARVFPAFSFLEPRRGADTLTPADPAESRVLAIRALLELLSRMSETGPVVFCLDDVQWTDDDSLELLRALSQSDFPLLLVAACQADEQVPEGLEQLSTAEVLRLSPLDPVETYQLAEQLSLRLGESHRDALERLHAQTGGSPFLICEWARYLKDHGVAPTQALRELLEERIAKLTHVQEQLLTLVAISGEPLESIVATRITGANELSDLFALRHAHLIRTFGRDGQTYFDVYHHRIREVACAALTDHARRGLHWQVALELERVGAPPERRIAHQIAAGEREAAAALALQSARGAEENLAFARAAELYDLALTLSNAADDRAISLAVRKARAFQYALRPLLAGETLRDASRRCAQPERASDLLRLAGEQLLLGGDVAGGLAALEHALHDHDLTLAASSEASLAEAFELYARLEAFGLEPNKLTAIDSRRASRIALCLSLARCLHHVDLRGIPFALRGLLEALEAGDLTLIQQAYAVFVMVTASHMPNALVEPALELCRQHTQRSSDAYAQALCQMAIAEVEHFRGHYAAAERACDQAEHVLLSSCVGVSRELGQVRSTAIIMQHSDKGDFRSHLTRAIKWLEDADRRRDVFHGNWLRAACSLAWMALDQPLRAREELARAERSWPAARGGTFETACVLYLDALDRYEDRPNVHERAAQSRTQVLESLVARTALLQGYLHLQRGWGCLRELGVRSHGRTAEQCAQLRDGVQAAINGLRALALPVWSATADALQANWLRLVDPDSAEVDGLLERAHAAFSDAQLFALAACTRKRRGELASGALGARWIAQADAELERLGVAAPERFARAYFSPF